MYGSSKDLVKMKRSRLKTSPPLSTYPTHEYPVKFLCDEGAVRTRGDVIPEQATLSVQHPERRRDNNRQQAESVRVDVFDHVFHSFLKTVFQRIVGRYETYLTIVVGI